MGHLPPSPRCVATRWNSEGVLGQMEKVPFHLRLPKAHCATLWGNLGHLKRQRPPRILVQGRRASAAHPAREYRQRHRAQLVLLSVVPCMAAVAVCRRSFQPQEYVQGKRLGHDKCDVALATPRRGNTTAPLTSQKLVMGPRLWRQLQIWPLQRQLCRSGASTSSERCDSQCPRSARSWRLWRLYWGCRRPGGRHCGGGWTVRFCSAWLPSTLLQPDVAPDSA
mmetsp:Transcript_29638/g.64494  ORF Transcript_29638/g.64494 Transcript_29638/m.64494 type:complete len:223 (+) Transcript_29638:952-1620(+)